MARFVELPDPTDHEPIQGPRLRIRPLTSDDLPMLMRWLADPDVQEFYGLPPDSLAEARDTYLVAEGRAVLALHHRRAGPPGGRNPVLPPLRERTLVGGDRHLHRRT